MIENPFLVREIRQHSHRRLEVHLCLLAALGVLALVLLVEGSHRLSLSPGSLSLPQFRVLAWLHVLLCVSAGSHASGRMIRAERHVATREAETLLPYSPVQALLLKLAFPLGLLGIAWGIGLPCYLFVAGMGLLPETVLARTALFPLAAGLGAATLRFLLPAGEPGRPDGTTLSGSGYGEEDRGSRGLLSVLLVAPLTLHFALGLHHAWSPHLLYGFRVPLWLVWAPLGSVLGVTAAVTVVGDLWRSEWAWWYALWARFFALLFAYFFDLGLFWNVLPHWLRGLLLVVLPALVLSATRTQRVRHDPVSDPECHWIAVRTRNPVLLKDLRAAVHEQPVGRAVTGAAINVGTVVLWLSFEFAHRGAAVAAVLDGLAWASGLLTAFVVIIASAARAHAVWSREAAANTLPLLFLTSLRSEEMVRGRLLAALGYTAALNSPLLLLALLAFIWAEVRGCWIAGPVLLAVSPALLRLVLVLGWDRDPVQVSAFLRNSRRERWLHALALPFVPLALFGCAVLAAKQAVLTPLLAWLGAVPLALLNAVLAWSAFRLHVRFLDAMRRRDVELPAP